MDQEKLLKQLNKTYVSRHSMLSRLPLGVQPEAIWQELLNRRRSISTVLPLYSYRGAPYWYITTDKMIAASEKVVETLYESDKDFDLYTEPPPVETLEEVFYTSYVEGLQITMQAAMDFLAADRPAEDIEEQLILNNRIAGGYASRCLYRTVDDVLIRELAGILTEGMDNGGQEYRSLDTTDFSFSGGESCIFPPARAIPERVNELCGFLENPQIHPLIKAAVSQAFLMTLRPFPEGNDRLGRILSSIILLRSGYTVFSEVSLSAIISRKSYAYYEAISNILQEENGGDLTYFVEYFFELLSRALDERKLRKQRQEEKEQQTEKEMARIPLAPNSSPPFPRDGWNLPPSLLTEGEKSFGEGNTLDMSRFQPVSAPYSVTDREEAEKTLAKNAVDLTSTIGQFSGCLLHKLEAGQYIFNIAEIADEVKMSPRQLGRAIWSLKKCGIIREAYEYNSRKYYQFSFTDNLLPDPTPGVLEKRYSSDVLDMIDSLISSFSAKDKRIGVIAQMCLNNEVITAENYIEIGYPEKWEGDMEFAVQIGLVQEITPDCFRIRKELQPQPSLLSKAQRRFISEVYASFGDELFSIEMVVATLDYSDSHVSACLHQFTLLKILDCRKEKVNQYQFIVTPKEHPEYFDPAA